MVVALSISSDNAPAAEIVSHRVVTSYTTKAITSVCQITSYQETCIDSLTSLAGKSPHGAKDLIRAAFQATIKHIKEAATKTSAWQTLEKDPRTRMALQNCEELADRAIYDLNRSYNKFGVFDINHIGHWATDMQIWLSGAVTYQETCLDGFEDTSGDAGKKMRMALNASMKLTSNALAMITMLSSLFPSLNFEAFNFNRRHLLYNDARVFGHGNELLPDWIDAGRRRLLSSKPNEINPDLTVAKDGTGKGLASSKTLRVKWEGVKELPASRIDRFTASKFIDGDSWIPSTGIPYSSGLFFPPPKEDASVKYSPEDPIESQDLERINKDKSSYHLTSDIAPVPSPLAAPPGTTASGEETPITNENESAMVVHTNMNPNHVEAAQERKDIAEKGKVVRIGDTNKDLQGIKQDQKWKNNNYNRRRFNVKILSSGRIIEDPKNWNVVKDKRVFGVSAKNIAEKGGVSTQKKINVLHDEKQTTGVNNGVSISENVVPNQENNKGEIEER
ncbi:hypothetical protein K7X08_033987 [Anisodus acutangulus]|uniref:Pectinesterase inhibitor domain-containing protein n=1 Tax=Anisodus acutangulus TaxID=402998 RepID=A0A9Q1LP19_9SOLA|nr:hypothetical protein K7X08_033987 [Anisodus acutangulus]